MIPLRLSISGFLSYREPVEIDFTSLELACISGPNGAGKSSLLDAITWALFGQARKRDDSVIHSHSSTAEVGLIFAYEGNVYRVRRIKPREKTMALEFQILQPADPLEAKPANWDWLADGRWKPLTESKLRETEDLIQRTLRMDYETFINASFFLQGKADQFTQQRSGDRKRILGSILGLEIWESYRQQSSERRRLVESEITGMDGQLKEISAELDEEADRRKKLKELQADLKRLGEARAIQEAGVQSARQAEARLQDQQRLVDVVARQFEASVQRMEQIRNRLCERAEERDKLTEIVGLEAVIRTAYAEWQAKKVELEQMEKIAERFRQFDRQREAPRTQIQAAKARLEQEMTGLLSEKEAVDRSLNEAAEWNIQLEAVRTELRLAEARLERRELLGVNLQARRQQQADLRAENTSLKPEMDQLKERIERLKASELAECPLCGQPLATADRLALIDRLQIDGQVLGDRFRENKAALQTLEEEGLDLEAQILELSQTEVEIRQHMARIAQLETQQIGLGKRISEWQAHGALRLDDLRRSLDKEDYAPEARQELAEIDARLKETGYDPAAHEAAHQAEETGRESEVRLRELEQAQAAMEPLMREISDLEKQQAEMRIETEKLQLDYNQAAEALAAAQSQAPDLNEAENRLREVLAQENRMRMEVGAAQQKVAVLEDLKKRRTQIESLRESKARRVQLYRQLERAFGKDGVPALLIEQALPEIENKANETLARLSGGTMSVQFMTQARYKDKNREDLKETLDIVISDSAGSRDYEMFSGGEAFRVNFAIRLALSEVLAQRAGARLQTLVIDEGFGSQDALGRQRLIEAINLVRDDFAKILVITHIDELKDAFPNRIEVEKTGLGSVVRIV
jgi:DNA repair protein SbcC/Rad50